MMQNLQLFRPIGLLCVVALAFAHVSHAGEDELDEIVVTATLRGVTQGEYAGSVTVLGADTLHTAGQRNFEDVVALVPNLNWAGDTSLPRYFQIRGIGELQQYQGAPNPSVGFLIDDIDFSGLGGAATLFDVDQIEVLRGPQGTLYGANALAGLIYVRSAAPAEAFGGRVELEAGDYGTHTIGAVLTGPVLSLDSSFRLAAQRYTSDGFYRNAYLGGADTDRRNELTVRGRWRYQPDDDLRIDLTVLRVQVNNGYDQWSIDNSRTTGSDHPGIDAQYSTGISTRATWSGWNAATVTAIATYADTSVNYGYDGDWGNPLQWAPYTFDYTEDQIRHRSTRSLEMRVASTPAPHGLSWLVGAYASELRETLSDTSAGTYLDPFDPTQDSGSLSVLHSAYRARNGALYGQLDGDVGAHARWSAGLRGERRTTSYDDTTTSLDTLANLYAPATANAFNPADDLWGGHVSLDYALGRDDHVYALLSRGYKAGGFNLSQGLAANEKLFGPESDLNIEAGEKLQFAGGKVHADWDVFYMRRKSLQLLTGTQLVADNPNTFVYYTGNARSGANVGLESSLQWQATRQLALGASAGLLHTVYRGFVQNGVTLPDRALPHAPGWQAAVHAEWRDPKGPFARVDVTGMAGFYYDMPPNPTRSDPFGLVNVKGGWRRETLEVALWVRNVLNKDYTVRGFYFGDEPPDFPNKLYTQLGDPRNFGLQLTFSF
ncbi:MAG: TonB-dependent receptor [Steroidobacterales bacterium]